ncbi:MAG: Tex-like N-terminal domain-containing protein, partial [Acidobacteriota bacterium]
MTDAATPAAAPRDLVPALAFALGLPASGVSAVIALLDEGNTVPFIARYRKERTGGLDEVQIRAIEERRAYLVELEERRTAILASVAEQGKLTAELEAKLRSATSKAELEDLYAPYRPRRKTRASVARDKGLEPLAQKMLAQGAEGDPAGEAAAFVSEQVATADDALAGARDIVAETIADTAEIRAAVRREYADHGELVSEVVPGKADEPTKFEQYYHHKEAVKSIPSHRFLAIRRGEAEGVLRAHVDVDAGKVEAGILRLAKHAAESPWGEQLKLAVADALKRLLAPSVENDVRAELKQRSDHAAVDIFAGNLRNLLLAPPLGPAAVIGVDPGLRTGCKCAAIDSTGKFLGTITIYIAQGDAQVAKAKDDFLAFVKQHAPRAIAVGNGTGGREAEAFVRKLLVEAGVQDMFTVQVSEAGASVYSASD